MATTSFPSEGHEEQERVEAMPPPQGNHQLSGVRCKDIAQLVPMFLAEAPLLKIHLKGSGVSYVSQASEKALLVLYLFFIMSGEMVLLAVNISDFLNSISM